MSVSFRQISGRPQAAVTLPAAAARAAAPTKQLAFALAAAAAAILAWPLADQLTRSHPADPAAVAAKCAAWDQAAQAAMARRLGNPERVGRQVYARSANMWLAEARRSCAAGSDVRAERFYTRIIGGPAR